MFKKLKDFKSGLGSLEVELVEDEEGNKIVLKHFKTKNKYLKEIELYELMEDSKYTPRIKYRDDDNIILGLEYCGESLKDSFKPKDRYPYKSQIRDVIKDIESEYGIYHNDLRWKNICLNDDSSIMLVDWERWGYENKERDPEYILTDRIKK
jgi:thiamine kinase-like enzyme